MLFVKGGMTHDELEQSRKNSKQAEQSQASSFVGELWH